MGHFGTSGAPREAILAPRDHHGDPWEEQDGHQVANNRIFVDLGLISGPVYICFSGPECLTNCFIVRFVSVLFS